MKNFGDYVYFIYLGNNKTYGFMTYTDPTTGNQRGYRVGSDDKGRPIFKKWRFNNDSMRIVRVGTGEIDLDGKSAVDFLRNSPECKGSKSGTYINDQQVLVYFKEMTDEQDAKNAVETRKLNIEAQNAALKLKGEDLIDFAAIIGVFDSSPDILTHRVLDFASNFPKKMLDYVNDPSRKVKSLIERALNAGVFVEDGKQIKWEGKVIGADKDDAVSNLMKDEKLKKAIELNLSKFGG